MSVVTHVHERRPWRAVAVPSEHGGWSLTLEPALLGLLVAPSRAGVAIATAALTAFVVRTPLRLVAVDAWRHRWLVRTRLAAQVAAVELVILAVLTVVAGQLAGWSWLVAAAIAAPLIVVELWFDMRSRSRRLAPELCGAVGMGAVAAAIAIAGGESSRLASALWLVIAARAVTSIPFVRVQIARLRHGTGSVVTSDRVQLLGIAVAALATLIEPRAGAGLVAVVLIAVVQTMWVRRPPAPVKVLGLRQLGLGVLLVLATAGGVLAS